MIAAILIILAGVFKAVADTLVHHYDTSIFKYRRQIFWNPSVSSLNAPVIPHTKYKVDAWHLANSGMIFCFILAAIVNKHWLAWYWQLAAGSVLFVVAFNTCYNIIFRVKGFRPK